MAKLKSWWFAFVLLLLLVACQEEPIRPTPLVDTPLPLAEVTVQPTLTPFAGIRPVEPPSKELSVCILGEPDNVYLYGDQSIQATAVRHAIYENLYTTIGGGYQAQGLEKMPDLADRDAVIEAVEVGEGERVVDVSGAVVALAMGTTITNGEGERVVFEGTPVLMSRMVVSFTLKAMTWSDGVAVTADDSVFSFEVAASPDTVGDKDKIERTAAYEATGSLTVRWTGLPGYLDDAYFLNVWPPLPRHELDSYAPNNLMNALEEWRPPLSNGPFTLVEWIPGDKIRLVSNRFYYRAAEGLPRLDGITFMFLPELNSAISQVLSRQCDIATHDVFAPNGLSHLPFLLEAEQNNLLAPYVTYQADFAGKVFGLLVNNRHFHDVSVMALCIDRERVLATLSLNAQSTDWVYDPVKANYLLDSSGDVDRNGDGIREDHFEEKDIIAIVQTTIRDEVLIEAAVAVLAENLSDCKIGLRREVEPLELVDGEPKVQLLYTGADIFLYPAVKLSLTGLHVLNFRPDTSQPSELWNLFEIDLALEEYKQGHLGRDAPVY
jgi:peptide/nickel transport system substrate-binding protein